MSSDFTGNNTSITYDDLAVLISAVTVKDRGGTLAERYQQQVDAFRAYPRSEIVYNETEDPCTKQYVHIFSAFLQAISKYGEAVMLDTSVATAASRIACVQERYDALLVRTGRAPVYRISSIPHLDRLVSAVIEGPESVLVPLTGAAVYEFTANSKFVNGLTGKTTTYTRNVLNNPASEVMEYTEGVTLEKVNIGTLLAPNYVIRMTVSAGCTAPKVRVLVKCMDSSDFITVQKDIMLKPTPVLTAVHLLTRSVNVGATTSMMAMAQYEPDPNLVPAGSGSGYLIDISETVEISSTSLPTGVTIVGNSIVVAPTFTGTTPISITATYDGVASTVQVQPVTTMQRYFIGSLVNMRRWLGVLPTTNKFVLGNSTLDVNQLCQTDHGTELELGIFTIDPDTNTVSTNHGEFLTPTEEISTSIRLLDKNNYCQLTALQFFDTRDAAMNALELNYATLLKQELQNKHCIGGNPPMGYTAVDEVYAISNTWEASGDNYLPKGVSVAPLGVLPESETTVQFIGNNVTAYQKLMSAGIPWFDPATDTFTMNAKFKYQRTLGDGTTDVFEVTGVGSILATTSKTTYPNTSELEFYPVAVFGKVNVTDGYGNCLVMTRDAGESVYNSLLKFISICGYDTALYEVVFLQLETLPHATYALAAAKATEVFNTYGGVALVLDQDHPMDVFYSDPNHQPNGSVAVNLNAATDQGEIPALTT